MNKLSIILLSRLIGNHTEHLDESGIDERILPLMLVQLLSKSLPKFREFARPDRLPDTSHSVKEER